MQHKLNYGNCIHYWNIFQLKKKKKGSFYILHNSGLFKKCSQFKENCTVNSCLKVAGSLSFLVTSLCSFMAIQNSLIDVLSHFNHRKHYLLDVQFMKVVHT